MNVHATLMAPTAKKIWPVSPQYHGSICLHFALLFFLLFYYLLCSCVPLLFSQYEQFLFCLFKYHGSICLHFAPFFSLSLLLSSLFMCSFVVQSV